MQEPGRKLVCLLKLSSSTTNQRVERFRITLEREGFIVKTIPKGSSSETGGWKRMVASGPLRRHSARVIFFILALFRQDSPETLRRILASVFAISREQEELISSADLIQIEDPLLIPYANLCRGRSLIDFRDLPTRMFQENPLWRLFQGWPLSRMIKKLGLHGIRTMTVSEGLKSWLGADFGARPVVVRNFPDVNPISPSKWDKQGLIEVVYAGRADLNRSILSLVLAFFGQEKARLTLFLVGVPYKVALVKILALFSSKVRVRSKLQPKQLVPQMRDFHFGFVAYSHKSPNLAGAVPNKFAEYILGGVPVIVAKTSEMGAITSQFDCGLQLERVSILSIRNAVSAVDESTFKRLCQGVLEAQRHFTWKAEEQKYLSLVASFLS